MSWGPITGVPSVESSPNTTAAARDRSTGGRGDTVSSFASLLVQAENSPLQRGGDDSQLSSLPKEKLLLLLERKQMEMNLRLLKSLGGDGETHEPVPAALGMVREGEIGKAAGGEASKYQQQTPKYDGSSAAGQLAPIIRQAAETYGVDQDLIGAVIKAESNFQRHATSPKGARGLMQLMPETAREMGVTDSYDPVENIMGGTRYLKRLLDRYQGNVPRALAAYNWGAGNVEKFPDRLPKETREYIARVTEGYRSAKV